MSPYDPHAPVDGFGFVPDAGEVSAASFPYRPIDCGAHDQLLALATRAIPCDLDVQPPGGGVSRVHGVIVDVYTQDAAEFLRFGDGRVFRLDSIQAIDGEPMPAPPDLS